MTSQDSLMHRKQHQVNEQSDRPVIVKYIINMWMTKLKSKKLLECDMYGVDSNTEHFMVQWC